MVDHALAMDAIAILVHAHVVIQEPTVKHLLALVLTNHA